MPDLTELESRGRDLRRNRRAMGGVAAALVLAVGGVAASLAVGDDRDAIPVQVPEPTELHQRHHANVPLDQGTDYTVQLERGAEPGVRARLTGPGTGWVWFGDGAIRMAARGISPLDVSPGRVPTDLPRRPFPDTRFGHPAAHVRISVPRLCPQYNDVVIWNLHPAEGGGDPGVGAVFYAGQLLDVWVVDVDGALVVVYVERSPGIPDHYVEDAFAFIGSLELTPGMDATED